MSDTFRIALRAMVVAAMTLLPGSTATAQVHVNGSVYGGGNLANVGGSVTVNMTAGTVDKDVYGGGALANTNTNNWNADGEGYELVSGLTVGTSVVTGLYTKSGESYTEITAANKTAEANTDYYKKVGTWAESMYNSSTGATANITTVNLTGGTVKGDAYGGGLGQLGNDPVAATVYGDISVTLGGSGEGSSATAFNISYFDGDHSDVVKSGRVFGCNNLNGSPKGNVTVTVNKTVRRNAQGELQPKPQRNTQTYEVAAVYGGGNLANFVTNGKKTHVIINGCDATSINYVYGGGNAAAVPETDVDINAAYEIEYVFGGGNGKDEYKLDGSDWQTNPGANVNGNANTMLYGGTIHEAFGGSNEKGTISGSVYINTDTNADCDLDVGKLYGAGKNADIEGDLIIVLGCKTKRTEEVYGGAENANVKGNVELTITSGEFGKVFGGNNQSGAIFGHIKLNIEETGCTPIIIDELYLGGNQAAYSVYGYYKGQYYQNEGNYYLDAAYKIPLYQDNDGNLYLDAAKNKRLYKKVGETYLYLDGEYQKPLYRPRTSASDGTAVFFGNGGENDHTMAPYDDPELNIISCTRIGKVFGGGLGEGAVIYGSPTVNINQIFGKQADANTPGSYIAATELGQIGVNANGTTTDCGVFGGGNQAKVVGNTTVNIGTKTTVDLHQSVNASGVYTLLQNQTVLGAKILSNVYGGGNLADVTGSTEVNICAKEVTNGTTTSWQSVTPGTAGVIIAGNVYGGGKGVARERGDRAFFCEEAMVGENDTNSAENNDDPAYADYGTHVRIGNGTIGNGTTGGNVYGGGEIGRVEFHTEVVIGLGEGTGGTTKSPVINGSVFGAGKGTNTHGYSGLVRGDSRVTIQADAKIGQSVYGGGEMASVGKYEVVDGLPKTPLFGGKCTVTIGGYAEIGPDNMQMTKEGGPDDTGHVFGAGKGTLPYENVTGTPWSMQTDDKVTYDESYTPGKDGLEYEAAYYKFIQSLGLASNSDVTIGEHAFVKGSVYGGSENGYLQADSHVTISGGQIGEGLNKTAPYADADFIDPSTTPVTTDNALATCATWTYDKDTTGKPYDKYATHLNSTDNEYYYDAEFAKSSKGGAPVATDGHTYYGNVFGGGRGVVPFAAGKWHRAAGSVAGNTQVDITAGHILSSVYGGNENTDVGSYALGSDGEPTTNLTSGGTCTINISGGTVGVPRTKEQIENNPVIGNVFGAGKGDKRVLFNTWTNVGATSVNISGTATIYGSVFGGGEDGHVIGNAVTDIGGTFTIGTTSVSHSNVVIGSTGISGADGNVFGGGRGSVTALTAGVVGGNANLTINKGIIMGNVYGGGRLASVGTNFTNPTLENGDPDPRYGELQTPDADHGNITVTVNDGTIGSSTSTGVNGNIFGGSKGTETNWKLGIARSTTVNMTGGTAYASVYGGGELAQVVGSHTTNGQVLGTEVNISGGTIGIQGKGRATWGNVFAGGKGNTTHVEAGLVKTNTKANISQAEGKTTTIYHNIYGGGAYGSVGTFDLSTADNLSTYQVPYAGMPVNWATGTGTANVTITGGTIGTDGKENGMVFGSSRGDIAALGEIHDKLAWVNNVNITVGTDGSETGPQIKGSVYGSGENGHTYNNTEVTVYSGTIGIANSSDPGYSVTSDGTTYSGAEYPNRGNVYGGGCGTDKYYSGSVPTGHTANDGEGDTYNPLAGIVYGTTKVTIDGGQVVHNVYGAGAMGSVGKMTKDATTKAITFTSGGTTTIEISGGTIGVDGTKGDGNVFGAARGDASSAQTDVALVKTTDVTISGDATIVWGNVYGGGQIGCVGTFDETAGKYVWSSGGLSKVTVSGGKIGPDGNDNPEIGNVFGAGKGKANTFKCEKAMVRETIVSISDGTVNGNVYGGGEIGRVEEDTEVTIGRKSGEAEGAGTGKPIINGSVFGAGKGKETHGYSALVRGNTTVTVEGATGAKVGNSVYGGGEIASVGRYGLDNKKMPEILVDGGYCYVKVLGNVVIGPSNASDDKGNVFGAGKGVNPAYVYKTSDRENNSKRMVTYDPTGRHQTGQGTLWDPYDDPDDPNDDPTHPNFVWEYFMGNATTGVSGEDEFKNYLETLALATHPEVTIGGNATVNSSVFGGGELGLTKGSVVVSIRGGTVVKDVYGGGSLANTNTTSTWAKRDAEGKPLPPDEHGNYAVDEVKIHPTTTVNLLGGSLRDAYGGGLGRLASTGVSAVEAFVYGDVKVELNNNNNGSTAVGTSKGCIVNRIFGCNNLKGSPKAKVQVYVYATQNRGQSTISGKTKGTYDVQAVYGGGNLSAYEPDDALLEYTDANKATVDAARTEVYIDGCDLTSIKQVYGGGNAASVPATYVLVNRAFEIDEVFGGGNGADDYSLTNGTNTVWYKNPGANVGYYDYTRLVTDQDEDEEGLIGTGSGTEADPYKNIDKENARTKDDRQNLAHHYMYGSGIATTEIKGGMIHTVYGGSNSRGNVRTKLSSSYSSMFDDCPMVINTTYGSGKNALSDGAVDVLSDCAKGISVMFGGAENADVDNDINLTITNGSSLQRVFGGNNTSGAINGSITVTIKEGGCEPIRIGELYAGGFLAPYSIYGYKKTNGVYDTEEVEYFDESDNTVKKKWQRIPLESASEGVTPKADPRINVISATRIDNIFGGGYQAKLVGSPHINVNMEPGRILAKYVKEDFVGEHKDTDGNVLWTGDHIVTEDGPEKGDGILAIGTIGNVYGGGNMADIVGDTYVEIGTGTEHNDAGELVAITPVRNAATITGNVFGGGKGVTDHFECKKAMVGVNNESDDPQKRDGGTHVIIGNGTVGTLDNDGKLVDGTGNVYGGGQLGRVERNTMVTIGLGDGTEGGEKTPIIYGCVFGAGSGVNTHGYAALVRGNSTVTIQGNAWVQKSVYGGGETATVGKYTVDATTGLPTSPVRGGLCTVSVKGWAEIGPDNMQMKKVGGPDDTGYVFGACKGVLPYEGYSDSQRPQHMDGSDIDNDGVWEDSPKEYKAFGELTLDNNNVLEVDDDYMAFINTLALATTTEVTIGDHAFIKGSVYGGSENGHVQGNTHVTIEGDCQIGNGDGMNCRYTPDEWAYDGSSADKSLKECASWDYGKKIGTDTDGKDIMEYLPYDVYKDSDSDDTPDYASDGHTFYGNVFGGGSGYFPYHRNHPDALAALQAKDEGYADGLWHREAGSVGGNTVVDITGGHILTSVYGGNECTDVAGSCTINMVGGTVGVPRTVEQAKAHPVTCYVFGAGKGDQRINFNTWTNVGSTQVNISGNARVYGSTFGGGEDGHVLGNVQTNIGGTVLIDLNGDGDTTDEGEAFTAQNSMIIGTTGTSGVDGNIFGGGRGFSETALTAGVVGGNVDVNIYNGTILGTVFGGGRLASVGTFFADATDTEKYGKMQGGLTDLNHGVIRINISGGTIGATASDGKLATSEFAIGDVFGGSKGSTNNDLRFGLAKHTFITMTGGKVKGSVYGGGEVAVVEGDATIAISGGEVGDGVTKKGGAKIGNVFGGGKGNTTVVDAGLIKGNTKVTVNPGSNGEPKIYHNIYGGGAYGSVGTFTYDANNVITGYTSGGKAEIYVTGGTIGTDGKENGMIFGSSRGDIGRPGSIHDKLAWVYDTHVAIGDTTNTTITTTNPLIKGSIYGGGENGHNYHNAYVRINGGTIGINNNETITYKDDPNDADKVTYTGKDYNYPYRGNVYGGGCGTDKYYKNPDDETHDGNGQLYNSKAGIVQGNAIVHISAGNIVRNVYGAGAMGSVGTMTTDDDNHLVISSGGKTTIAISGGTLGVDGTDNGNVFGAARGDVETTQTDVALVKKTGVTISQAEGKTTRIYGNVYGGGALGDVGTYYTITADGNEKGNNIYLGDDESGVCTVTVTGGTIGSEGNTTVGHVFGAGKGDATTYTCQKAMVKGTTVTVSNGTIYGNVYGGGEVGRVEHDAVVRIGTGTGSGPFAPIVHGSVFGAGAGLETHGYSALVRGNSTVTVQGNAKVRKNVYGGGETATVGKYWVSKFSPDPNETPPAGFPDGMPYKTRDGGLCTVTIQGDATVGPDEVANVSNTAGHVFGAGKGVVPHYVPSGTGQSQRMNSDGDWESFATEDAYLQFIETLALASNTNVTIGGNAAVKGSVYGGSESGFVQDHTIVTINKGEIGTAGTYAYSNIGNIFGGGRGISGNPTAGRVGRYVSLTVNDGTAHGSVYGGGEMGVVKEDVTVNILGGTVAKDVYGGGALANTNISNWTKYGGDTDDVSDDLWNWTDTSLKSAKYTTTVNLHGGTIGHNVYGGGLGEKPSSTNANGVAALVYGDVTVKLNETTATDNCVIKGVLHGANNYFGTPKGDVTVHVYKTQGWTDDKGTPDNTDDDVCHDVTTQKANNETRTNTVYELKAVYGGGNEATYDPVESADEKHEAHVIIDGCDLTSIETVYGGGNAAAAPATHVEVNSCYEIGKVFAGGNGKDALDDGTPNFGAHIGYRAANYSYDSSKTDEENLAAAAAAFEAQKANLEYGTGEALAELWGGTIHSAFGGSNTLGNVRTSGTVTLDEADPDDCPLCIEEVYGAGNEADQDGTSNINLGCLSYLREMYGGAKNADINNDIELNIQSGRFDRVFGGNNLGGDINGSITVNIEETGCHPIIIGQLFGGGNQAAYTVPSGKHGPTVNVKSFTSIGEIYGGGYGESAVIHGDTYVNINEYIGDNATMEISETEAHTGWSHFDVDIYDPATGDRVETKTITLEQPTHDSGAIGSIGNVFGGGNEADVDGNTNVRIGNMSYVPIASVVAGTTDVRGYYILRDAGTEQSPFVLVSDLPVSPVSGVTYYVKENENYNEVTITAEVTDVRDYYTRSGEGTEQSPYVYTLVSNLPVLAEGSTKYYKPVLGANITGNVYGGGNAADVTGDTNVVIGREVDATP